MAIVTLRLPEVKAAAEKNGQANARIAEARSYNGGGM